MAALERDRADRGLVSATQTAREAVAGLAGDGPVRLVNAAKARLRGQVRMAEHYASASTGGQAALHEMRTTSARRSLAELERLPINGAAARLRKAIEQRRERAARLPDVTRFGQDASGRSTPDHGLSR